MGGLLINFGLAVALSAGLGVLLRRPAVRIGLVDRPCERKAHQGNVPLVGGVSVVFSFLAVWFVGLQGWQWPPVLAAVAFLALGLVDDMVDLRPLWRLLFQSFVAAWLVAAAGLVLSDLGQLTVAFPIKMEWAAFPFAVACLVALTNAINMVDGHDGVAGGLMLGALLWLGLGASLADAQDLVSLAAILTGAVLGFVWLNFPSMGKQQAKIFLGDSGSMALAVLIGWLALEIALVDQNPVPPVVFAWILALPVIETGTLIVRRVLRGRNPLASDREHLHHYLLWLGFSRRTVTVLITLLGFSLGGFGMIGWWLGISELVLFGVFLLFSAGYLALMECGMHGWQRSRERSNDT